MLFQSTLYAFLKLIKAFGQTENGLERGFVKHGLDSFEITGPVLLTPGLSPKGTSFISAFHKKYPLKKILDLLYLLAFYNGPAILSLRDTRNLIEMSNLLYTSSYYIYIWRYS